MMPVVACPRSEASRFIARWGSNDAAAEKATGRASPTLQSDSERRQQFAESVDRAGDLAAPQRTPNHRIHPGDHGGIEILFQEVDIVDAAPAAARNVNAVGFGSGFA